MKKRLKITEELTPKALTFCPPFGGCPAIFETNKGSYALIGKKLNAKALNINKRVGKDEVLIEVPKELIDKKK
ncbi:unnamed protein product [marine sediment metagenome]|uniref:Uncharacterized protein n=1 Tax=marine sediment metagenome TaxID=412755 RepID=X1IUP9_9ZZZZ